MLDKLPLPGRSTILITVGQGPTALAVGAGGGCLDIFTLIYPFSPLSPSLWETARYRLKYCLKGPLNPRQPTNHRLLDGTYLRSTNYEPFPEKKGPSEHVMTVTTQISHDVTGILILTLAPSS